MKMFFLCFYFFWALLLSLNVPLSVNAIEQNSHAKVSLQSFVSEGRTFLAVIYKNDEHWHTYWKNPGDAGTPLEINFNLEGIPFKPTALEWPIPQVFLEPGDMQAFGYEGEYALFFELSNDDLLKLNNKTLEFNTKWLICENQCIWGEISYSGVFKKGEFVSQTPLPFSWSQTDLEKGLQELPHEIPWPNELEYKLHLDTNKEGLVAHYKFKASTPITLSKNKNLLISYPVASSPVLFQHESIQLENSTIVATTKIKWEGNYRDPEYPLPTNGLFPRPLEQKFLFFNPSDGTTSIIKKEVNSFDLNPPPVAALKTTPQVESQSFFLYLFLAFIGGLILNLMPCVFPVISLKLFSLIKKSQEAPKHILAHNLMYTLGVLLSFLTLATIVIILKQGGEEIGWGFQLQSPLFVSAIIIFLFIFVLNLFGLFEFHTPGGRKLAHLRFKGHFSHFMEGILATILSTPCSAPFLGTALTFAFTSSPLTIILIFLMIGLGLSLPFILVGFFPQTIRFFPKPGHWMENLRKFLGLTLIFTIIWLMGVLLAQAESIFTVQFLLLTLTLIFFSFFFFHKISSRKRWQFLFAILIALSSCALVFSTFKNSSSEELSFKKWSPELMNNHEKIIFIDFTADWCLTCKVNEAVVLKTEAFQKLAKKYDVLLLVADWTKKDPIIAQFLNKFGASSVPAYFIQSKKGKLYFLGETISLEKIEKTLQDANEN